MKVEVVESNCHWPEMYESERQKIAALFGRELVEIYHIGSTSVPGLAAKPVIDLLAAAEDIHRVDRYFDAMVQIGYEPMGEYGIPGRRYFRKGQMVRTHQLHIFDRRDRNQLDRHLAFRDYLRSHADVAEQYGRLKRCLADQFPDDIDGYCDGKDAFVKETEKQALSWWVSHRTGV